MAVSNTHSARELRDTAALHGTKTLDHLSHPLLPVLNERFQNSMLHPFSRIMSIFVYSFIKIGSVQYAKTCHEDRL